MMMAEASSCTDRVWNPINSNDVFIKTAIIIFEHRYSDETIFLLNTGNLILDILTYGQDDYTRLQNNKEGLKQAK